jgi:hypothetical protein
MSGGHFREALCFRGQIAKISPIGGGMHASTDRGRRGRDASVGQRKRRELGRKTKGIERGRHDASRNGNRRDSKRHRV